jgi:hypothetical protein
MFRPLSALVVAATLLSAPATAQSPDASEAQDLSYCAGAVASAGRLNILTYPQGASGEWAPVLGRILEQLNTQEWLEGYTGRVAADEAKRFWNEQPRAERDAVAQRCRESFGD